MAQVTGEPDLDPYDVFMRQVAEDLMLAQVSDLGEQAWIQAGCSLVPALGPPIH